MFRSLLPVLATTLTQRAIALLNAAWSGGAPGGWWSNRGADLTAGTQSPVVAYQDAAGTTPASAINAPVGLWLDRKRGNPTVGGAGLHLSQGTLAARPLKSSRVNLLTKTEVLDDPDWTRTSVVVSGMQVSPAVTTVVHSFENNTSMEAGLQSWTVEAKASGLTKIGIREGTTSGAYVVVSLVDASIISSGNGATTYSAVLLPDGYVRITLSKDAGGNFGRKINFVPNTYTTGDPNSVAFLGDGVSGVLFRSLQCERGSVATRYQRVNTATDYDAAGFPVFETFDGVDDVLASAAVAAGAVGNANMDCFILMKRNSSNGTQALLASNSGYTNYFGIFADAGASLAYGGAVGTPSYVVNSVAVPGGAETTRGQLWTALGGNTIRPWVLLEAHNLNLSEWTALGMFGGLPFNGNIAEIILCPAQSGANRTLIRRYMGNLAGLAL